MGMWKNSGNVDENFAGKSEDLSRPYFSLSGYTVHRTALTHLSPAGSVGKKPIPKALLPVLGLTLW